MVILAVIAVVVLFKLLHLGIYVSAALEWMRSLGPWAPLWFMLLYIAACVLFIPGSVITLGAGALFGPVWGTLYVSVAAIIGATLSFLLGRFVARDGISLRIAGNPRFRALDEAVGREGWKIVLLTRLSPVFPFTLLNYAFGLTRVSLRDYVLASWVGMLPGTVLYVYIGSVVGDLSQLGQARTRTTAEWVALVLGLVVTAVVAVLLARLAKQSLSARLPGGQSGAQP